MHSPPLVPVLSLHMQLARVEGAKLGTSDGAEVVGLFEGLTLGTTLGAMLGTMEGTNDGTFEGCAEAGLGTTCNDKKKTEITK